MKRRNVTVWPPAGFPTDQVELATEERIDSLREYFSDLVESFGHPGVLSCSVPVDLSDHAAK